MQNGEPSTRSGAATATEAGARLGPVEANVWRLLWLAISVACVFPLFKVQYLPIQDLPQHLAAIRVLHDFDDAALGFSQYFELQLLRTQYLTVYFAVHLLAYVLDLELAMRVVAALVLVSVPWSLRALLHALGRDGRMGLLAFPLAYNAHFLLGFLNFIGAIALLFFGLALAVRMRVAHEAGASIKRAGVQLALIALACFYTHIVPFALLGLGVFAIACGRELRKTLSRLVPLVPSGLAALAWLKTSAAGEATLAAAQGGSAGKRVDKAPAESLLREAPHWLTDILAREDDRTLLQAWAVLMLLALLATLIVAILRARRRAAGPADALVRSLARRLYALAPLCVLLYFVTPSSYDWIWPIAQRFPLLAALCLIVWVAPLPRIPANLVAAAAFVIACACFHHAGSAFGMFSRMEVGDFDRALSAIPEGKRVAGLIYGRGSRQVAFSPFIHFVAYYQARKGGAVMFTFADFPQSPFRFRDDNRPPRVPPRWEWTPERVRAQDLAWYDYVLVRGQSPRLQRPGSGFTRIYAGERWSVLKRE